MSTYTGAAEVHRALFHCQRGRSGDYDCHSRFPNLDTASHRLVRPIVSPHLWVAALVVIREDRARRIRSGCRSHGDLHGTNTSFSKQVVCTKGVAKDAFQQPPVIYAVVPIHLRSFDKCLGPASGYLREARSDL